jgi:hypothetical protein
MACELIDVGRMMFLKDQLRLARLSLQAAREEADGFEMDEAEAWVADCVNSLSVGVLSPVLEDQYHSKGEVGTRMICY